MNERGVDHNTLDHSSRAGPLDLRALPAGAQEILAAAVESAAYIEAQAHTFPANSPGERLLRGLQRKLFIDDYMLAAHLTERLPPSNAAAAFHRVQKGFASTSAVVPNTPVP